MKATEHDSRQARKILQHQFCRRAGWLLLNMSALAWAQRSTPGAGSNSAQAADAQNVNVVNGVKVLKSPNAPQSQPQTLEAYSDQLNLGDYVELDESIRNEMYGTIDFPNADLKDIIKAISKLTNKNFILDQKIQGRKVTIVSPEPVTKQEAYNAFLSALYMNDLALVSMGKFLKIVDAKSALQSNIRVFVGDYAPASEEIVTLLYPLKHLNAEEIQRFLVDLVPRQGRVSYYPNTNTLVMTDAGLNLRRIISILKAIDVPGHQDQLETIQIHYASAKGIAQLIEEILDAQSGGTVRTNAPRGAAGRSRKTRGGGIISKIVPDERTNSLVVLANGRGVEELRDLVDKLDTPNAAGGGNIHIYYCKNAVADELATTINALISGQQSNKSNNTPVVAPPPGITYPPNFNRNARGGSGGEGVKLEGSIKVTADKATNSLVVVAAGSDYAALKKVLEQLDIPRRQVYVEGTIMEINIQDEKDLGVGVNVAGPGVAQAAGFIPSNISATQFAGMVTNPAGLNGLMAGFKAGQNYTVNTAAGTISIGTVMGLIKAIVTSNQGQILHQPQILTSDNKDAEIKVETKVPYLTETVTQGTATTTATQVNSEKVTISLKITPQIGEDSDLIKLTLDQSVDNFQMLDLNSKAKVPQVTNRKATTTVTVRDGDTVAVGGLQTTDSTDTRSKFPLLGDLPILGWLFRGTTINVKRSNLMLFLTPRIINEYNDVLKITAEKIENRNRIVDKHADAKDRTHGEVQKMMEDTEKNMAKAPPRSWGYKPKPLPEEGEEKTSEPSEKKSSSKGSAYIDPSALGETARESVENSNLNPSMPMELAPPEYPPEGLPFPETPMEISPPTAR